jgi:hypothetical protein
VVVVPVAVLGERPLALVGDRLERHALLADDPERLAERGLELRAVGGDPDGVVAVGGDGHDPRLRRRGGGVIPGRL